VSFIFFLHIRKKGEGIYKSTEGGHHGKEGGGKGSSEETSDEKGDEETSEGHRKEEVIPSFSAPVMGRGGTSFFPPRSATGCGRQCEGRPPKADEPPLRAGSSA